MFKDLFSQVSTDYAKYRPKYPEDLFKFLASLTHEHDLCWDCATGNGQAAVSIAKYYSKVIATDASKEQISNAARGENIEYIVANASERILEGKSVDIVTIATAIHWFNPLDEFYNEVRRVLKPGGIIACWSYYYWQITPKIDEIINPFGEDIVARFGAPELQLPKNDYKDLSFPFQEISAPEFYCEMDWNMEQWLGYMYSWSHIQTCIKQTGKDPIENILPKLTEAWGDKGDVKTIRSKLGMKVGMV